MRRSGVSSASAHATAWLASTRRVTSWTPSRQGLFPLRPEHGRRLRQQHLYVTSEVPQRRAGERIVWRGGHDTRRLLSDRTGGQVQLKSRFRTQAAPRREQAANAANWSGAETTPACAPFGTTERNFQPGFCPAHTLRPQAEAQGRLSLNVCAASQLSEVVRSLARLDDGELGRSLHSPGLHQLGDPVVTSKNAWNDAASGHSSMMTTWSLPNPQR